MNAIWKFGLTQHKRFDVSDNQIISLQLYKYTITCLNLQSSIVLLLPCRPMLFYQDMVAQETWSIMVSLVCFTAALGTKKKVEHRQGHVEKTERGLGLNLSVQVGKLMCQF